LENFELGLVGWEKRKLCVGDGSRVGYLRKKRHKGHNRDARPIAIGPRKSVRKEKQEEIALVVGGREFSFKPNSIKRNEKFALQNRSASCEVCAGA